MTCCVILQVETADVAAVGADSQGDDFVKLMKSLEVSAAKNYPSTPGKVESEEQVSSKDNQKVSMELLELVCYLLDTFTSFCQKI